MSQNLMLSATLLLPADTVITSYSTTKKRPTMSLSIDSRHWLVREETGKVRTSCEIRCNQTSPNKDKAPTV